MKGKAKSPVTVQSTRPDVSAGLSTCWDPEEAGANVSEGMGLPSKARASRQRARLPSSMSII